MAAFTELDLSKVRTRLLMRHPFFGSLAMRLKYEAASGVPTLATDGEHLVYNPEFMGRLTNPEQQAVIVHEIAHCAFLHMFRRQHRNLSEWNIACDYAINLIIEQDGLKLPREVKDASGNVIFKGPFIDAARFPVGMSAEAIYAKLQQEKQKQKEQQNGGGQDKRSGGQDKRSGQGSGNGPDGNQQSAGSGNQSGVGKTGNGKPESDSTPGTGTGGTERGAGTGNSTARGGIPSVTGEFTDGKTDAEGGKPGAMNEADWKIAVEQALSVAKAAGKLPGGWVEEIKANRVPKMDPWAIIEQYVARTVESDFSWTSPNRRLIAQGLYMPGPVKENMGEIVIGLDTSGSASSEMLAEWASHISEIAKTYLPEKIHVVMCDTKVTNAVTYESSDYDNISFQCKGRGGTAFQPVFDWIEEQGIKPEVVIYFTDGYGPSPIEPEYPVVWAIPEYLEKQHGPFGETVYVGVE